MTTEERIAALEARVAELEVARSAAAGAYTFLLSGEGLEAIRAAIVKLGERLETAVEARTPAVRITDGEAVTVSACRP